MQGHLALRPVPSWGVERKHLVSPGPGSLKSVMCWALGQGQNSGQAAPQSSQEVPGTCQGF